MTHNRSLAVLAVILVILASPAAVAAYTTAFTAGGGTTYSAPSGLTVTVAGDHGLSAQNPITDSDTVNISGVEFQADGAATATVDQLTGTTTDLSGLALSSTWLHVRPPDKQAVALRGSVETARIYEMTVDDGATDLEVGGPSDGNAEVQITGLPADTYVAFHAADGSVGGTLKTNGTGVGTAEVDLNHQYQLETFTASGVISNVQPADGTQITSDTVDLSADIDHPSMDGGSVEVRFVDGSGSIIGSTSMISPGTASTTWDVPPSGGEWHVEVSDGPTTVTSATQRVFAAEAIELRQEQAPGAFVDNTTIEVEAYAGDEVFQREVSDGLLDMAGLPDEVFVSAVGGNYTGRIIYVPDVSQRQRLFLLNASATDTVEVRFALNDPSGAFTSNARLRVKRPLTINNETRFRTIVEDKFGQTGLTTVLEADQTYRLVVVSADGSTRESVGRYTADVSETVSVAPGAPEVEVQQSDTGSFTAGVGVLRDDNALSWSFEDPAAETDALTVRIHPRGEPDNLLVAEETYFDVEEASSYHDLTDSQTEQAWTLNLTVEQDDGETIHVQRHAGQAASAVPLALDQRWRTAASILALLLFAGVFSLLNRGAGAVSLGVVGGLLWWTGWLSGVASAAAIVVYLFLAILYQAYTGGLAR